MKRFEPACPVGEADAGAARDSGAPVNGDRTGLVERSPRRADVRARHRSRLLVLSLAGTQAVACTPAPSPARIAVATTTSVDNSGLLAVLLPAFRSQTGVDVQLTTPGSGIALAMLADGHVDAVISHAPGREADLLAKGGDWFYRKIMFNDFVLVGPADDPAGVKQAATPEGAMRRIAGADVRFISRGDSSGTHQRERELWARAGVTPNPARLVVAGSGMGATLRIAAKTAAYALTDRGTWDQHAGRGGLMVVFEGGTDLLNTYAAIVRPAARPDARRFAEWLADGDGRRLIAEYRTAAGTAAFIVWPVGCPGDSPDAVPCGAGTARRCTGCFQPRCSDPHPSRSRRLFAWSVSFLDARRGLTRTRSHARVGANCQRLTLAPTVHDVGTHGAEDAA